MNADYPSGAFLRPSIDGSTLEQTQLRSAFVGFYWAVVSATTTGYGDIVPTSVLGRALAICCMFLGVLMLALPVTVLSANFNEAYDLLIQEHREKLTKKFATEHVINPEENGDPQGYFDSPKQQKQTLSNIPNSYRQHSIADLAFQSNISFSHDDQGSLSAPYDEMRCTEKSNSNSDISYNSVNSKKANEETHLLAEQCALSLYEDIENIDRMFKEMGEAIKRLKRNHKIL